MLKATNIHKSFGNKDVLLGLDVSVKEGEITCLIGPSGTGKTTLLRALGGLDMPDQGTLDIDGTLYTFSPTHKDTIPDPWPHITVVFQSLFLWPHLTLRENILLPARNRWDDFKAMETELDGLIASFEMAHFIDQYPNEASLGQRQRVAIARAIMVKPKYILMDEITSSLDIEQVYKILTRLEELKGRGIGILLITHQIGFAKRAADHIVFMDKGETTESGNASILTEPKTKRLKEFLSMVKMAH